jgi:hypothetical protein
LAKQQAGSQREKPETSPNQPGYRSIILGSHFIPGFSDFGSKTVQWYEQFFPGFNWFKNPEWSEQTVCHAVGIANHWQ